MPLISAAKKVQTTILDSRHHGLPIVVLLLLAVLCIFLINGFPIPLDSHYYVAMLPYSSGSDAEIRGVYTLLKSPIYFLLGWVFLDPGVYAAATITLLFALIGGFYACAYRLSNNRAGALCTAFFLLPFLYYLSKVPGVGQFFLIGFPIHFGHLMGGFAVRGISGLLYIGIVFFTCKKSLNWALLLLLAIFFIHPNNALSIGAVFFLVSTYLTIKSGSKRELCILVGKFSLVTLLGVIPSLIKLNALHFPGESLLSTERWYHALLHDEGDDFSALYYILSVPFGVLLSTALPVTAAGILVKTKKATGSLKALPYWLVAPSLIFVTVAIVEWVTLKTAIWPIFNFLVPTQLGMKILELAYVPLLFTIVVASSNFVHRIGERRLTYFSGIGGVLFLALVGSFSGRFHASKWEAYQRSFSQGGGDYLTFLRLNCLAQRSCKNPALIATHTYNGDWDALVDRMKVANCHDYHCLDKFRKSFFQNVEIDSAYNKKYQSFDAIADTILMIETNIPHGAGIIVPPYMNGMRDSLVEYDLFYTDKDDGNIVLGGRKPASIVLQRMTDLLGLSSEDLLPLVSGLYESHMRSLFLDLGSKDFKRVSQKYPKYNFVIVERDQDLNLTKVVENAFYSIYRI